jgi:hypothetical protein
MTNTPQSMSESELAVDEALFPEQLKHQLGKDK